MTFQVIVSSGSMRKRILIFYPRSFFRIFDFPADSYASVPKCYGLLDETALEVSGILKLQQQPALALKGQGVMIGFIDTGIDYRNPVFQYSDGTTRIYRIWDQTIRDGTKPEGIAYGSEYKTEQINAALRAENPLETVQSMDTNGHGTFVPGWHVEARMWKIILSGRRRFPRSQS